MQWRYYRVGLYGTKFEELDGKEYVYKKNAKDNLAVVTNSLKVRAAYRGVFCRLYCPSESCI
jgi:hypothetical protein